MRNLTTEAELAEMLGKTPQQIGALRRKHCWPHVYMGRYDRRYTDAQLDSIIDQMTRRSTRAAKPKKSGAEDMGRTSRSASRRSS